MNFVHWFSALAWQCILHGGNTFEDIYGFLHQLIGIMYIGLKGGRYIRMAKSQLYVLDIGAALDEQGSVSVTREQYLNESVEVYWPFSATQIIRTRGSCTSTHF